MSTCNRLDLGTLGSRLMMPKNLPGCCHHHMHHRWKSLMFPVHDWGSSTPPLVQHEHPLQYPSRLLRSGSLAPTHPI
jgi:hypothetical protein